MRAFRLLAVHAFGLLVIGSCSRASEPEPATPAAAQPSEPSAPLAEASAPEATPPEATPPEAAPAASSGYPMCVGQRMDRASGEPRSGKVAVQLAPAFLDEMTACKAEDAIPKDKIAAAGEGHINAKGDCEFPGAGISCHYHSGSEFISTATSQQTPGQGELHCIFPSDDPKSPRVYGGHVVCKHHEQGEVHGQHASHEVKQGAVCSSAVLGQIEPCQSFRCCDDGSLTNPIADLAKDGRNDVRPDFRICSDTLEVDCDLLESYSAHPANSPALGGVKEPVFAVAPAHKGNKMAKHAGI
jgi:hypothetical protein